LTVAAHHDVAAWLARNQDANPLKRPKYALHPDAVDTEIWRVVPDWARPLLRLRGLLTPEEGARTTLPCATVAPQHENCGA